MRGQGKCILTLCLLPAALSARAAGPLDYDAAAPFAAHVEKTGEAVNYTVWRATFASPVRTIFPRNDTVWVEYRRPHGPGPFPAVVVLPVLAAPNRFIAERFLNALSNRGIATAFVTMPHQFERRARPGIPSGQGFLARDPARLATHFRQAVLDVRRALSWLEGRPEIDRARLGVLGTSLGAIAAAAVISVDDRVREGVLLLGGADLPALLREGALTAPVVRDLGLSDAEISKHFLNMDALSYREKNRGKRPLLYNARWDRVVPRSSALALARAFPDAEQRWVWGGHYSAVLHLVWMPGEAARHFRRRFFGE